MTDLDKQPDEIDFVEILRKLWIGRKTILITTAIFLVVGIFLAIIAPKEYESKVTLLVEPGGTNPAANSAILKQLSALTGVPAGGSQDALTPSLYPLVVGSVYFRLDVLNQQVTDPKSGARITLARYLDQHPAQTLTSILTKYTIGLPGTILGAIRGNKDQDTASARKPDNKTGAYIFPSTTTSPGVRSSLVGPPGSDSIAKSLSRVEKRRIGMLKDRVNAEIKKGTNLLNITVKMNDPVVAKELAGSVVNTLTGYVIDYRTRKVKNDQAFIEELHAEAQVKYKLAQQRLAAYNDRNQNVVRSAARTEGESLKADYDLAFNVYTSLSQLLEQAKINVQENTPVFTMIEPPSDAVKTSGSLTTMLIIIILGLAAGIGLVYGIPVWRRLRENLRKG
ncbi:MAG: Wzz/FepE/Etk N-terminal domain-containing protein [Bacteroidales bacterium]|nr:Wzz/FepE/Etk N-terminal domain-containing protein [Bacteroidales bacterium]